MARPVISLEGKIVLITGAGRGLGYAYAEACCEAGARVIVAELRESAGRQAAARLAARGFDAVFVPLDLAEPQSVRAMADAVGRTHQRLDGLVNNGALADGVGGKSFEETTVAEWDRIMDVNVRGSWLTVKECARYLRRSAAGRVLNIASDTALWGPPRVLHYKHVQGCHHRHDARACARARPRCDHRQRHRARADGRAGDCLHACAAPPPGGRGPARSPARNTPATSSARCSISSPMRRVSSPAKSCRSTAGSC